MRSGRAYLPVRDEGGEEQPILAAEVGADGKEQGAAEVVDAVLGYLAALYARVGSEEDGLEKKQEVEVGGYLAGLYAEVGREEQRAHRRGSGGAPGG